MLFKGVIQRSPGDNKRFAIPHNDKLPHSQPPESDVSSPLHTVSSVRYFNRRLLQEFRRRGCLKDRKELRRWFEEYAKFRTKQGV